MITEKYPTDTFEDAVQATAYIARVDVTHGELRLPPRVREHLADGDVVVHLVRGGHDVAEHTAQLTSLSKLVGIDWPADVVAGTRVTVMCPRGAVGHDVAVLLPDLPGLNVDWPDDDLPTKDPEPEPVESVQDDEPAAEPEPGDEPMTAADADALAGLLASLAASEQPAETTLPGPAEYEVPTVLRVVSRDEQPTETIPAVEQTAIVPAVGELDWPADEPTEGQLASLEVVDLDRDYRPRWRRAVEYVRANWTPARATYITATASSFVACLVTWLVTR